MSLMNLSTRRICAVSGALLGALALAACDQSDSGQVALADDGSAQISMVPPTPILAVRAIVADALRLSITVGDDTSFGVRRSDGTFGATVQIPRGEEVEVTVLWEEAFRGELLELAEATKTAFIDPAAEGAVLTFTSGEFDSNKFDDDLDGRSNLAERRDETDPDDISDPGEPVADVTVPIELSLPSLLQNADDSVRDALSIEARINRQFVSLIRDGDVYRGSVVVSEDTDIFSDIRIFRDSTQFVRLARYSQTSNSGAGVAVVVGPDDYQEIGFDLDRDGRSNLQEVAEGTDPDFEDSDNDGIREDQDNCPLFFFYCLLVFYLGHLVVF